MPAWEQLERLLSGLYLKELEQEENIWRSLPFFSAALALEVVALNQIIPVAASLAGVWRWLIGAACAGQAVLLLGVLLFLYRSIRRQSFSYISSGADLVAYLRALEAAGARGDAAERLRQTLVEQLATAADANRISNQGRAGERARAGILLLASLVTTFFIVGATIVHETSLGPAPEIVDAATPSGVVAVPEAPPVAATAAVPGRVRVQSFGLDRAAEDAGGEQGLDDPGGVAPPGGRGGGPR
jgi:hypothetical protein